MDLHAFRLSERHDDVHALHRHDDQRLHLPSAQTVPAQGAAHRPDAAAIAHLLRLRRLYEPFAAEQHRRHLPAGEDDDDPDDNLYTDLLLSATLLA